MDASEFERLSLALKIKSDSLTSNASIFKRTERQRNARAISNEQEQDLLKTTDMNTSNILNTIKAYLSLGLSCVQSKIEVSLRLVDGCVFS